MTVMRMVITHKPPMLMDILGTVVYEHISLGKNNRLINDYAYESISI